MRVLPTLTLLSDNRALLCFPLQVLTAICPAPTVALATGVVSVTAVPPAVATPAQDMINPSSPLAKGVQGLAVVSSQPGEGAQVEVKQESQLDAEDEDQELFSCASSFSLANSGTAGNNSFI